MPLPRSVYGFGLWFRRIDLLSHYGTGASTSESEVLFKARSRFRVISKERMTRKTRILLSDPKDFSDNDLIVVVLEEV